MLRGDSGGPDPAGRPLLEAFPALASRLEAYRRVIETGEPHTEVLAVRGRAGNRWYRLDGDRCGDGMIATLRDVTAEEAAPVALVARGEASREREEVARLGAATAERFTLAMTHAAVGTALVAPDGAILEVNEAFCRIMGRTAGELRAATWQDLTHPDDLDSSGVARRDLVEGRRDSVRLLKRYLRPDASILWCDVSLGAVRDDAGGIRYLVSQVLDVTERIEAEAALRASEERYRTLVGEIDGVVFVKEPLTGTTFCSGQVQQLLGFPPETMVLPGVWRSLVVEEDVERAIEAWEAGDDRDEYELEYRMRRADGTVIWVEERWRSSKDAEGRTVRWSSVVTDITARRRLEETVSRTDRLEAVSRVAAAAAHDFGDVLTAIQFAHGNLVDAVDRDDPRAEDVRAIGDAVHQGIQLTKQLLAFGRDRAEADTAPLDVAWLLADLEQILRGVAGTANLSIHVVASGLVRIARSALEQAVLNLVINARDAMPTGGSIRITLERERVTPDAGLGIPAGPYLALGVADTGCGMPVEVQEKAFEPFFTTKPHGSGIGLPSVYGTMRSVGGTVRIESLVGEGTTVCLLMPEAAPASPATT
jgi:PAS domain S-box-containing protein